MLSAVAVEITHEQMSNFSDAFWKIFCPGLELPLTNYLLICTNCYLYFTSYYLSILATFYYL